MRLETGRLGPFEIVGPLGKGGMGEVYLARDTRLLRKVAVKVLPQRMAGDPEAMNRFEREARAASALDHPNIVTIHEIGQADGSPFIAMELIEGRTLSDLAAEGPLPVRKALELASQIASGLAAAHAKGIVHRDLKPQNVMIAREGLVKILDFGLAKLMRGPFAGPGDSTANQLGQDWWDTSPGAVMGSVGYMSPEQACGRPTDYRTDQFSLGVMLYEMILGKHPFRRPTPGETLSAIIRDEAEPLPVADARVDLPLHWILDRCLAKDPDERYASTHDLKRDLEKLRDELTHAASAPVSPVRKPRRPRKLWWASVAVVAFGAVVGLVPALPRMAIRPRPLPKITQLTFQRGTVWSGRFAPDGETVVYSAAWEGAPFQLFRKGPEGPESLPLAFPSATILSISTTGDMAVDVDWSVLPPGRTTGMLARAPLAGGEPRRLLADVQYADWTPAGDDLAVIRTLEGKSVLEYPVGTPLHRTTGWMSNSRVSPGGDLVAFMEHPIVTDDRGSLAIVDRSGKVRTLCPGWRSYGGLAWSPHGDEIWIAGTLDRGMRSLQGITLSGTRRLVLSIPGLLNILDVSRQGHVLIARENRRVGITMFRADEGRERDLSFLDSSLVTDLSEDGKLVVFEGFGEGCGEGGGVYLRKTDDSPAVKLGEGWAQDLSPDGAWVLTINLHARPTKLILLPTGAGRQIEVAPSAIEFHHWAGFFPDGKRILIAGNEPQRGLRLYWQSLEGGAPTPITPEGIKMTSLQGIPISPDSEWVAVEGADGIPRLFPVRGGASRPLPGVTEGTIPIRWSADGRFMFVYRPDEFPARIYRLDPARGTRTLWREIMPADRVGIHGLTPIYLTPDGKSYAYTYARFLHDLYLLDGLL